MNWEGMYRDRYAVARIKRSIDIIIPFILDGDIVLDIGCFTQEAKKYLPNNIHYIGIDSKSYMEGVKICDLESVESIPNCNITICLEVLEHLNNPEKIIIAIRNSIKNNGYVVISLPNEATLFHRIRCLFGTVDAECFASSGKHLHLPSLNQCRKFLNKFFVIHKEVYYINPSATGSRQAWLGKILQLIPDYVHQWLADTWPSLFARGFIFFLTVYPYFSAHPKP